jgi:4'-phosphopantetheinyl transferase
MASPELLWNPAPPGTVLEGNEVQVWCVALDSPLSRAGELMRLLSPDELERADRFKFEQGRQHYIVGRATLRRLLGDVLQLDPATLKFDYIDRGKPALGGAHVGKLHFNVSHSHGLALIAVTRCAPVGVDIEYIRPVKHGDDIARRFFTASESAGLAKLAGAERPAAFFNLWTRKEAWLKATGAGIADSLNRAEFSFLPDDPPRVLNIAGEPGESDYWTVIDLKPATGFTGALAARTRDLNVRCWRCVE